jgi:hypothetical protein
VVHFTIPQKPAKRAHRGREAAEEVTWPRTLATNIVATEKGAAALRTTRPGRTQWLLLDRIALQPRYSLTTGLADCRGEPTERLADRQQPLKPATHHPLARGDLRFWPELLAPARTARTGKWWGCNGSWLVTQERNVDGQIGTFRPLLTNPPLPLDPLKPRVFQGSERLTVNTSTREADWLKLARIRGVGRAAIKTQLLGAAPAVGLRARTKNLEKVLRLVIGGATAAIRGELKVPVGPCRKRHTPQPPFTFPWPTHRMSRTRTRIRQRTGVGGVYGHIHFLALVSARYRCFSVPEGPCP